MNIDMPEGRYVVAVSGGVDSMVLLDVLRRSPKYKIVVAHYDHGIRDDSVIDRKLVQQRAKELGLQFVYGEGNLGYDASEAKARDARYEFLHKVRDASKAHAVVTAHHKDDLLETAILNLLRGTGRKGLGPLTSSDNIQRPLIDITKPEIHNYAREHNISWREDSTNLDTRYLRNYIRHKIIPKLSEQDRQDLFLHINDALNRNHEIEQILTSMLHTQPALSELDRHWFIMLPHDVACEVMKTWLERHAVKDIDKKMVNRLVMIAKTSSPNRVADIDKKYLLQIGSSKLKISKRNR